MKSHYLKTLLLSFISFPYCFAQALPDPHQILQDCITATQSLSSYKCSIEDSSSFFGFSNYQVTQQRADVKDVEFGKSLYSMSGYISHQPTEKKPISMVYNGSDIRMLDNIDNSVYLFTDPSPKQLGAFSSRLEYPFPFILSFWNLRNGEDSGKNFFTVSYSGSKKIYDVDCYMLKCSRKFKRPDTGEEITSYTTYLIGQKDHISRGYETDKQKVWVKMEEYNRNYAFSSFVISVPEGFDEKKVTSYTPPNIKGLLTPGTLAPVFVPANNNALSSVKNKVVLIDFWGTWCGPCRLAMPHLQSLYKKYKTRGLEVIGISVADPEGAPEKYMKDNNFTYSLFTKGEATARSFQVDVFPTIYLIGKDGKIIFAEKGIRDDFEADISKLIEKALEQ